MLLKNEVCVFSFKTFKGKEMLLAKDSSNKYLIYRFGTSKKVELEYPLKDKSSWNKFTYNFYFRGGGKQNSGVDIDNLSFINNGIKYVIYSFYCAGDENENEVFRIGILIHDPKKKVIRVSGNPKTLIGNCKDSDRMD